MKLRLGLAICLLAFLGSGAIILAESSGFGSNPDNYYCPKEIEGGELTSENNFKCTYRITLSDGSSQIITKDALPRPPQIRIIQAWFIRILYVIWGFSGIVFTGLLMWLGFQYLTSFGNPVAIADVIKALRKWIIGLALIFLSYPALNTLFSLLPINDTACYAEINMPGFQFFFPNVCVSREKLCADSYPELPPDDYLKCVSGEIEP